MRKKYLSTRKGAKKKRKEIYLSSIKTRTVRNVKWKSVFCNKSCTYCLLPADRWPNRRCELCVPCAGDKPGRGWETIEYHWSCCSWDTTRFVRNASSFLFCLKRFLFVVCLHIGCMRTIWPPSSQTFLLCRKQVEGHILLFFFFRCILRSEQISLP